MTQHILYIGHHCDACHLMRDWLVDHEVDFTTVNLDQISGDQAMEVLKRSGSTVVPQLELADGSFIHAFNIEELEQHFGDSK